MDFYSLTPERILDAVEQTGMQTTGRCMALNSLENRVYDVELEDERGHVVAKFYRPGRWSRQTILDEHRLLTRLKGLEIPVCAPLPFPSGETLSVADDIYFAVFPKARGRSPDEMTPDELHQTGRLLARIHNAAANLGLVHRPTLSPQTYGSEALAQIVASAAIGSDGIRSRYVNAVERLVAISESRFAGVETIAIHADCHKGNLLRGSDGLFFLDFDDMAVGPPVQDLWLVLPSRISDCAAELDALIEGYEQFRPFERSSLRLVEVLRGLRYVRYAAWISARWQDPSFPRAFPQFGTDGYWEQQWADLEEQLQVIAATE
ncbi:MAG: serine/threonine protein kinase [Thermomicrobiales bacterium]